MPFQLPNQTSFALIKPVFSGSTWVRPSDWISITNTTGEVQFLVSDVVYPAYRIRTTFTRPGAQNIYIDWGDGVVDTISTTTATNTDHIYTTGGTPSTQGYNTWKIRIYGDAGAVITEAKHIDNTAYWGAAIQSTIGLLEAYYGDNTITTLSNLFNGLVAGNPRTYALQYVKCPSTITTAGAIFDNTFRECYALAKVDLPTSMPNNTGMLTTFTNCVSLKSIVLPQDMTAMTTMSASFQSNPNLINVVLPPTLNSLVSMGNAFDDCPSLGTLNLPETNSCYSWSQTFRGCRSLTSLKIKSWSSSNANVFNFTSAFQNCSSLEDVELPNTAPVGCSFNMQTTFDACRSLKVFTQFPTNFDTTNFSQTFQNCSSLTNVVLPSSIPSLTNMANAFNGCSMLGQVVMPTLGTNSVSLGSTFGGCASLSEIVFPSGWTMNGAQATFQTCSALRRVVLPATHTGFFQNCFNSCFALQEVVMPTTMTGTQNMTGTFQFCYSLTGCTMPASMNSCTTFANTFDDCRSLVNVVLPTSATALTSVAQMFRNAYSIKSITLPATTGLITTMATFAQKCYNLKTLTLPTTQSTTLTTLNGFLDNANNITTLNNQQFLGNTSTTSTTYIDGTNFITQGLQLTTLDLYTKFSKFVASSGTSTKLAGLTSLRLRNNGSGQYGGSSPQIDISYNSLGQAALVQVFNDLPTITAKTINITGCPGASLLTPAERAIATGKGWTITG